MDPMKFDAAEAAIVDEDYTDDIILDGERCELCSNVVIDRGLLDCCSDWFCFACIDKWGTIENHCPMCKNKFELITCVPVYDTIGSSIIEEHPFPREDDWCVQGDHNTLSFPSYYIDEDEVVCLDGDGCKLRTGLAASEEDLTLDTSIACDSCNIWYHTFCVEFNPAFSKDISWFCPRCVTNGVPHKSEEALVQNPGQFALANATDPSFSQKVSVTVSSAGETAVVVSLVDGKHMIAAAGNVMFGLQLDKRDCTVEKGSIGIHFQNKNSEIFLATSSEMAGVQADVDMEGNLLAVPSPQDSEFMMTLHPNRDMTEMSSCSLASHADPKANSTEKTEFRSCGFQWNNLTCSSEKVPTMNSSQNNNTSKPLLDTSPKPTDVQTNVDLEDNSIGIQSLHDSSCKMAISPSYKDRTEMSSPSPLSLMALGDLRANGTEGTNGNSRNFTDFKISSTLSMQTSTNMTDVSGVDSLLNPPRDISGASSFSVHNEVDGTTKNNMVRPNNVCPSELFCLPEGKMVTSAHEEMLVSEGEMVSSSHEEMVVNDLEDLKAARKFTEKFQSHAIDIGNSDKLTRKREESSTVEMEEDCPAKKAKSGLGSNSSLTRYKINSSGSENSQKSCRTAVSPKDANLTHESEKQANVSDIMGIVEETNHRPNSSSTGLKSGGIDKRNNATGLRVKKIMRRAGDEKESSIIVQKLRKEIKEAVQDKNSKTIDNDSTFDAKLLTAFRAALVKPKSELVNKPHSSSIHARKSVLQKGKVRENLTKKIYASSTGRRKRAWDRDREVEFWKHRCKGMKPEKVETLQSVLEFLKKAVTSSTENSELDQGSPDETNNSILSRVYLADVSVFPRKDDIKPLSALAGCSLSNNLEKDKEINIHSKKDSEPVHGSNMTKKQSGISMVSSLVSSSGKIVNRSSTSGEASCTQVNGSSGSQRREHSLKEPADQLNSAQNDKRKWAMEVLARKNALLNLNASKENQEDTVLKGKYPLLAQLPAEMRPALAPTRQSKVSVSVRQAQLFRFAEQYLRSANLPVIRRTAITELAIADAVNVENDIFEKSNSKLVYMNLCSQFISQLGKKSQLVGTDEEGKEDSSAVATDCSKVEETLNLAGHSGSPPSSPCRAAEGTEPETTGCSKVEEALKLAGLLDSPPNSPCRIEDTDEQAIENVLDIDARPELDIYGDFEYDLEEEGYTAPSSIVAGAVGVSKVPPEIGDSRIKVVLSTLKPDPLIISEVAGDGCNKTYTAVEVKSDCPPVDIFKEVSEAECEELYGPLIGGLSNVETEPGIEIGKLKDGTVMCEIEAEGCAENSVSGMIPSSQSQESHGGRRGESIPKKEAVKIAIDKTDISSHFISKKVEAYVKEHIRPLCKSGVITAEQYRWAVRKTSEKVMKYHHMDKNANFLIKEGEKVKKLAQQYVEAAQHK